MNKKRVIRGAVALALCGAMLGTTSCIGKFALSNRLLAWNQTVGNKFVNELVFFAFWVLPIYEVCVLADVLVINSIEFWSGSNPMLADASEESKAVTGQDGRQYLVVRDAEGYTITCEDDGMVMRLDYDAETQAWSWGGHTLFSWVDDSHVLAPDAMGNMVEVELSTPGLWTYRAQSTPLFAAK